MEIRPNQGPLGADVIGFAFAACTSDEIARLRAALRRHLVLRFRDTALTDAEHAQLSSHFRPAADGSWRASGPPYCELLPVTNMKNADGSPAGVLGDGEVNWHTDGWFREHPFAISILRSVTLPERGGDTHFSNMYAAYDSLPSSLLDAVAGRAIHHQTIYTDDGGLRMGMSAPASDDMRTWPGVDHPICRTPAGSHRKCLYLGRRRYASIRDLPLAEGEALLDALWRHATRPELIWTQTWRSGDMLMWDNRCVLHMRDAFDPNVLRLLRRTSEEGERPV